MKKSNIGPRINFQINLCVDPDSENVEKEIAHEDALPTGSESNAGILEDRVKDQSVNSSQRNPKSVKFEPDVVICVFDPSLEVLSIEKAIQYHSSREIQIGMIKNIRKNDKHMREENPSRSILKKCREGRTSYSSYEQSSSY